MIKVLKQIFFLIGIFFICLGASGFKAKGEYSPSIFLRTRFSIAEIILGILLMCARIPFKRKKDTSIKE